MRQRQRLLPVLVVVVATSVAAGCGLFGPRLGVEGVDVKWVDIDGHSGREALVVAPEDHFTGSSGSEDLPLVVVLHGLGSDALEMAEQAEWPIAARDVGFVAVFPQGEENSWNAGGCCGVAAETGVNDVAFLDAVIAQMVAEEGVDPEQVYVTGYSNGGMLTYLYACLRADVVAGFASVAGTDFSDCEPSGAVDFIQVSGSEDPVVPVLGGDSSFPGLPDVPSVEESLFAVAAGAGCAAPSGFELNGVTSFQATGCRDDAQIRYDVVAGLDHSYPNAGRSPEYVAVDKIVEFWGLTSPT